MDQENQVTPEVTPVVEPSVEDIAQQNEEAEWNDAAKDLYPDVELEKVDPKEENPDEQAKPEEETKTPEEGREQPEETPEQKAEREAKEAAAEPPRDAASEARESRNSARESIENFEAVKSDVRDQLYPDLPKTMVDADGDPINGPQDVAGKLINPVTEKPFTIEEAGMWYLAQSQAFNQRLAEVEKHVEQVTQVNIDLKDWSDAINAKYSEILQADPKLRNELWNDYEGTLVKDEKTGVITAAPVNLERFYERALSGKLVEQQMAKEKAEAEERAAAEAKKQEEANRKRERKDRDDIYGGSQLDDADDDEKEWGQAAESYYGNSLKR